MKSSSTRLPAKSVGRCRCVSKPWRALLSQPNFIRTHIHRSRINPQESLIFLSSQSCIYSAPLNHAHHLFDEITLSPTKLSFADHPDSWTWVHASCDGLVLVTANIDHDFVINPITREIREVPGSPFAYDQCSTHPSGLGYDSVSDDYKIVTLFHYDPRDYECEGPVETFVNVYSLKVGSWKRIEIYPYDHWPCNAGVYAFFLNGCIHWLARRTTDGELAIVAFDLAEEKFREVPHLSSVVRKKLMFEYRLAVLGGCLCLFNEKGSDHIWMMNEYGVQESWTKFTINYPEARQVWPLCLLGQEEVVVVTEKKLVVYNLKEGTAKNIVVRGIVEGFNVDVSFLESLVSPHGW